MAPDIWSNICWVLAMTWALSLGAALGLAAAAAACNSRQGADTGASASSSGSGTAASGAAAVSPPASAPSPGDGSSPPPVPVDDFRALSETEVRTLVTPRLRAGEQVAHQPFRGPLGPAPDGVLVVVERDGKVSGFVLVPGAKPGAQPGAKPGAQAERIDLPPLSQGRFEGVPAVLFIDVDGKPGKEAILMTRQMSGAGPAGATPRAFNQVIAWSGSAFVRLSDIEAALLDLETAAAIRKALAGARKQ
ncbi:MAG TPA: hypothetical protein VNO30_33680 [Kofleriaceae bacterium]|nr:hypothetical protein [Kofleriaceae bacterium]